MLTFFMAAVAKDIKDKLTVEHQLADSLQAVFRAHDAEESASRDVLFSYQRLSPQLGVSV